MLDAQIPEPTRRRSTFYVSLTDSNDPNDSTTEELKNSKVSVSLSAKKGLLAGLFRSPSGLDLGRNSKTKNGISSLESLNKKDTCEDELNKTSCSISSIGSESDFSYNSLEHKEDTRILAKRVRRREYSKRTTHLLRNSLENCSTPSIKHISKTELTYQRRHNLKPIELFDINKTNFQSEKNVLSPIVKEISKRNSMLNIEDTTPKYSPKCVTLPNNLSAKAILEYSEKKAASKPREIALSPSEPPGRKLVGFSFIRRTHSTKINRSPSLLKALTSKCVDDGQVQRREGLKEDNKKRLIDDEDQGVLSGKMISFV